jgi:hypothetical protein
MLNTRLVACLLVLMQVSACEPENHAELHGSLYFGVGQYLAELELHNGNVNIETNLGDVEILGISPQKDKRLLVSVVGNVAERDRHSLVLYELDTRQALTIAYGRNGHYLPGTAVLLYDDGSSLILAERDDTGWQKTEVAKHRFNAVLSVMPVATTRFLYAFDDDAIHFYDTVSRSDKSLTALSKVCELDASLWDAENERLLCRRRLDDDVYQYAMVGLDGVVAATLPLPASRMLQPMAFLPDQDALVLTERWRRKLSSRQNYAVWIYRFDSGEFYRLLDNQYLGRAVVYLR